jgi:hypothetical protein
MIILLTYMFSTLNFYACSVNIKYKFSQFHINLKPASISGFFLFFSFLFGGIGV